MIPFARHAADRFAPWGLQASKVVGIGFALVLALAVAPAFAAIGLDVEILDRTLTESVRGVTSGHREAALAILGGGFGLGLVGLTLMLRDLVSRIDRTAWREERERAPE
ncbi:MAG: hypothetical protein AAFX39_15765 [Pseudomonadota bacterium]